MSITDACSQCCRADESKEVVVDNAKEASPGINDSAFDLSPVPSSTATANLPREQTESTAEAREDEIKATSERLKKATLSAPSEAEKAAWPGENLPAPRSKEFEIAVSKAPEQADLGVVVDYDDRVTLKVIRVKPGLIQTWNEACSEEMQMRGEDRIVGVNGVRGSTDEIIAEVAKATDLKLIVQRRSEMMISLRKKNASQSVGVDIDSTQVTVLKVKDGPVKDYNDGLSAKQAEFAIQGGDRIVEVNGVAGSGNIIQELTSSEVLHMVVVRSSDA